MRLRSDEILIGTTSGVIKTRTVRRRVEEAQWDPEFAKSIKGEPRQPVPGIKATTFLQQFRTEQEYAWKKISRMLVWHNRMNSLIHRKHEKFGCHQPSSSSQKRVVSEEWDHPPEKFWRMSEEDVTMRQDITATRGASSSSASRGPAMDTESRPSRKRAADVQTEDLEE